MSWKPDEEDRRRYRGGRCIELALAIQELRPTWRLVLVGGGFHVAAQSPDGRCLDIEGWREWPYSRVVDLDYLKGLEFDDPHVDKGTLNLARRLLEAVGA